VWCLLLALRSSLFRPFLCFFFYLLPPFSPSLMFPSSFPFMFLSPLRTVCCPVPALPCVHFLSSSRVPHTHRDQSLVVLPFLGEVFPGFRYVISIRPPLFFSSPLQLRLPVGSVRPFFRFRTALPPGCSFLPTPLYFSSLILLMRSPSQVPAS